MRKRRARPAGFADHGRSPTAGMLPPRQVDDERLARIVARYSADGMPAEQQVEPACEVPTDA